MRKNFYGKLLFAQSDLTICDKRQPSFIPLTNATAGIAQLKKIVGQHNLEVTRNKTSNSPIFRPFIFYMPQLEEKKQYTTFPSV